MAIRLVVPSERLLAGYVAALRTGWSPDNTRDVSGRHLVAIEADAGGFLAGLAWRPGQMIERADGTRWPRLPGQVYWIEDEGAFRGFLSFRYQPGTEALPDYAKFGHVGYGVVPWARGRGVASAALRLALPVARGVGLDAVTVTADLANLASQAVIRRAGGVEVGRLVAADDGRAVVVFRVPTGGAR